MTTNAPGVVLRTAEACQDWGQLGFPIVARVLEAMAGVERRAAVSTEPTHYEDRDPRRT